MPIVPLTMALAVGIVMAYGMGYIGFPPCASSFWVMWQHSEGVRWTLFAAPLALLPLAWHLYRTRRRRWWGLVPLYTFLGIALYTSSPFYPCLPPHHVGHWAQVSGFTKSTVMLTGVVDGWPDERERFTFYRLRAQTLRLRDKTVPVEGWVRVKAPRYPEYRYGDRVRVVGILQVPPVFEDFDYRRYLARKGIYAVMRADRMIPISRDDGNLFWRTLYTVRERSARVLDAVLPAPYAALAQGILLGIEGNIPRSLYDDFNATGTSHIIVISGFNIAIVTGLLLALLGPLVGIRSAAAVAIVGVGMYVLFVGADAAVLRAGIMGSVYASSLIMKRRPHVLNTLFFAAMVMLALSPLTLWDVGFQLSFLATLGLIIIAPTLQAPVHRGLEKILPPSWKGPIVQLVDEAIVLTLAAQIATMPLIIGVFGRASLVSPLSNMLILPVQPLVMIGAGLSTVAGWLWLPAGRLLALLAWLPLAWTVKVVEVTARWPGAGVATPEWMRPLAVGYYVAFAMFVVWQYARLLGRPFPVRWPRGVLLHLHRPRVVWPVFILLWGGALAWGIGMWARVRNNYVLRIQPTGVVWQSPRGLHVRFFGLGEGLNVLQEEEAVDAAVWVVLHTDVPSLVSVRQAMQISPPRVLVVPPVCGEPATCSEFERSFLQTVEEWGIRWVALTPYTRLYLGDRNTWLAYLSGGAHHVYPLLLRMGNVSVLLPSDVPVSWQETWADKIAWPVPLILPLPPPEQGTWPTPRFLRATRPALVLLPSGVTYPPTSQKAVDMLKAWRYDPDREFTIWVNVEGEVRR